MSFSYQDALDYRRRAQIASFDHRLGLGVEQCKHPAVPGLVFWLWFDGRHVGTVSVHRREDGRDVYLSSKIDEGRPYTSRRTFDFSIAVKHAGTDVHDQPHRFEDWHPRHDLPIPAGDAP